MPGRILSIVVISLLATFAIPSVASVTKITKQQQYCSESGHDQHPKLMLPVQSYQQTTKYTCGPAIIMSLLRYYNKLSSRDMTRVTELRIAKEMGTTEQGTTVEQMTVYLKKWGFVVDSGQGVSVNTMVSSLKRGVPTLLLSGQHTKHWVMLTGYREKTSCGGSDGTLIFSDPNSKHQIKSGFDTVNADQLENDWFAAKYYHKSRPQLNGFQRASSTGIYIQAVPANQLAVK